MARPPDWQPERYRAWLRFKVRQLHLDRRLQARFDSSDLVQETWLKVQPHLHGFRGQTEAQRLKWLDVILTNVVADQVRKATADKRDVGLEQSLQAVLAESNVKLEGVLAANQSSPSGQVERAELLLRSAEALEQLPQDQREVIELRYLLDTPVGQIAAQLDRTPKSVAGLLHRGLKKLRELLAADQ
jgi:RNA polymerase sigma-70 factor (ECF subfamily)